MRLFYSIADKHSATELGRLLNAVASSLPESCLEAAAAVHAVSEEAIGTHNEMHTSGVLQLAKA